MTPEEREEHISAIMAAMIPYSEIKRIVAEENRARHLRTANVRFGRRHIWFGTDVKPKP